ncbi:MAG: Omp28-related outer membrane protein [Crocinitomicaceae bacterium]
MRILFGIFFSLALLVSLYSCDKIDQPFVQIEGLDTSLYEGGNFINYKVPTFGANTNSLRNVLIEDFTGHTCGFCPPAAERAKVLEENNPNRVFSVAIHAAPNAAGTGTFQSVKTSGSKFRRDFTTPEGKGIASYLFNSYGGDGNPVGNISRVKPLFLPHQQWTSYTDSLLQTNLIANVQVESSFFPGTRGVYIHSEVEFLAAVDGEFAVVIYAVDNEVIDWQKVNITDMPDYKHHNVHIGNVFAGETFGRTFVNGPVAVGEKFRNDFSYQLPVDLPKEDMHFLIFVVNKGSEEVLQVIKHEI